MADIQPTTLNYDPTLPVYAAPDSTYQNVDVQQQPTDTYIDPSKATVEGRVTGLLSSGNPLLTQAQTYGQKTANTRGLLNSSMGVQAATGAVMDKAISIATPDAQLYGNSALSAQNADQTVAQNNQLGAIDTQKAQLSGKISGALATQNAGDQIELQKLQSNAALQQSEVDNQWKQQLNWDSLDASNQQALEGVQSTFGTALTGGIERIMRDTNVTNKTDAIQALMTQYQTQMTTAASIVNIDLNWS